MNKTTKTLAILFTAGLLLAGCVQKDNTKATTESTSKSTTKVTAESKTKESSKAKTSSSTTVDTKEEDSTADAQKTVLEFSDEAGKSTMTLYYKGDTLLVQEKADDYDVSKVPGENPLESMKGAVDRSQEKFKDLMGHGFELTSEYKNGIYHIYNRIDYTKIDIQKLKEIFPTLNLEADNTISYSKAKELYINSGYVEK